MVDRKRDFHSIDINGLKPPRGARTCEWSASAPKGLSLRASVDADGNVHRAWQSRYTKPAGGSGRLVYGSWPEMDVAGAVAAHAAARELLAKGVDPVKARTDERLARAGRATVSEAITDYTAANSHLSATTLKEYRRLFNNHLIPRFGDKAIADITTSDLRAWLREEKRDFDGREAKRQELAAKLKRTRTPRNGTVVTKLHLAVSSLMTWAMAEELITINPVPTLKAMNYTSEKTSILPRPLSPDEIGPFWTKLDNVPIDRLTRAAIRLLCLTGARANEILSMKRRQVKFNGKIEDRRGGGAVRTVGVGYIELTKTKTGKPRITPLCASSRAILADLLANTNHDPDAYLFPVSGDPTRHRSVTTLDKAVSRNRRALGVENSLTGRAFTVHCLRSTAASVINGAGFSTAARLVLGHAARDVHDQHYNAYDFLAEQLDAIRSLEAAYLHAAGESSGYEGSRVTAVDPVAIPVR